MVEVNIFYYSFCAFRAQRPEAETGCIYEWDGIKYLIDTTAVNYHAMTPDYVKHPGAMSEMACKYIKEKKPAFAVQAKELCSEIESYLGTSELVRARQET